MRWTAQAGGEVRFRADTLVAAEISDVAVPGIDAHAGPERLLDALLAPSGVELGKLALHLERHGDAGVRVLDDTLRSMNLLTAEEIVLLASSIVTVRSSCGCPASHANRLPSWCAFARLARPFASVRPTPRRTLYQPRRVQLRLRPGVAPTKSVLLANVLVKCFTFHPK